MRARSGPPNCRDAHASHSLLDAAVAESGLVAQLRAMLAEWQAANAQWQAAYGQMSDRCERLDGENRHLRDVIEAAESGPDTNARFVARLARQNLRLGQEAASHGVAIENGDTPTLGSRQTTGNASSSDDSGRKKRPAGVKRLPLHRVDDPAPAVTHAQWDVANQSDTVEEDASADEFDTNKGRAEEKDQFLTPCKTMSHKSSTKSSASDRLEPPSAVSSKRRLSGALRHIGSSGSTRSALSRLVGYAMVCVSMSVMAITFFFNHDDGQSFDEL